MSRDENNIANGQFRRRDFIRHFVIVLIESDDSDNVIFVGK